MRVGVIGASPERGWAQRAHIPALQATPGFELVAVSTSREDSARRAGEVFGVAHAFSNSRDLIALPEVDLVVITVKVAAHAELARAAVMAGKHVYCEWPLALTSAEATELERTAHQAGVRTVLGLQARYSPGFVYGRELIRTGYLGRVTSVQLVSTRSKGDTVEVPGWTAYTYEKSSGAGLVEVLGGQAIDLAEHLLGPFTALAGHASIQHEEHSIAETGASIEVTAADHLDLIGEAGGAAVSVHLHDGELGRPRTQITVNGTRGTLVMSPSPTRTPRPPNSKSPISLLPPVPPATAPRCRSPLASVRPHPGSPSRLPAWHACTTACPPARCPRLHHRHPPPPPTDGRSGADWFTFRQAGGFW